MKILKPLEPVILYLNTETNCTKKDNATVDAQGNPVAATRNLEFSWNNISPIFLNEYTIVKVFSVAHDANVHSTDHSDNIITIRLKDVIYNPELYRSTDNSGYPIIHAMPFDSESTYNDLSMGGLYVVPQTINRISLIISDSMTNPHNGVLLSMKFIIGLVFIPYDRVMSAIEDTRYL